MRFLENKKLTLNYKILNEYSSGIELLGHEVKSLRKKEGSLEGAKIIIRGGEAFLIGAYIPPYQASNIKSSYDPYRNRKLLLNKEEIADLYGYEMSKTLTLHPISLYLKNNLVKCGVAVCKKKDARDKREEIKKEIARREFKSYE